MLFNLLLQVCSYVLLVVKPIDVLEWVSQSPDINPRKNLRQDLSTDVHRDSLSNLTEYKLLSKEKHCFHKTP